MELEDIRQHCLSKPGVTEDFPFDDKTLAFRVSGKIFLLTNVESIPQSLNLKCEPSMAVDLREAYEAVAPGYHMNKKHWNTVTIDGSFDNDTLIQWIEHSYDRVVLGLTRAQRDALNTLTST